MFQLDTPTALILLPLPWLIWYVLPQTTAQLDTGLPVPFLQDLRHYFQTRSFSFKPSNTFYFFTLIWALLITALAGPQWIGPPLHTAEPGRNIFLVLDVSGSMSLPDMQIHHQSVTRLSVVKQAAENFVRARHSDHIGLILFGSEAYLQTPLTYDHQTILKRIQDATVGLAGKTTSIGDALGLAIKKLRSTPQSGRVMILLTDGSNNSGVLSPQKAAEIAQSEHIKIYTIGLAAEGHQHGLMQLFVSMQGGDLDEKTLKHIAQLTGGAYFRATDPNSLQHIYQTIDQLETTQHRMRPLSPKIEYYPWLVGLCLLLFTAWLLRYWRAA